MIYGHPAAIHTPEDVAKMEQETGRHAVITRKGVRLDVVKEDPYDQVDMESWTSTCGDFSPEAA